MSAPLPSSLRAVTAARRAKYASTAKRRRVATGWYEATHAKGLAVIDLRDTTPPCCPFHISECTCELGVLHKMLIRHADTLRLVHLPRDLRVPQSFWEDLPVCVQRARKRAIRLEMADLRRSLGALRKK